MDQTVIDLILVVKRNETDRVQFSRVRVTAMQEDTKGEMIP